MCLLTIREILGLPGELTPSICWGLAIFFPGAPTNPPVSSLFRKRVE